MAMIENKDISESFNYFSERLKSAGEKAFYAGVAMASALHHLRLKPRYNIMIQQKKIKSKIINLRTRKDLKLIIQNKEAKKIIIKTVLGMKLKEYNNRIK